jgi:hypothetical protein
MRKHSLHYCASAKGWGEGDYGHEYDQAQISRVGGVDRRVTGRPVVGEIVFSVVRLRSMGGEMTTLRARAEALKHDLLHNPAGWDKAIDNALREAVEAAAQVAERYMHETGVLACKPPKSEAAWHIANEIRRTLLSEEK